MNGQGGRNYEVLTRPVVWALVLLTVLWIPMQIRSLGFMPPDDGLRHVAKAISGKPWQEILVMRPGITIDHNAGWHAVLSAAHRWLGWGSEELLTFALVSLFLLVNAAGLASNACPEAWVGALLLFGLADSALVVRLMLGRPLLVAAAATIVVLRVWTASSPPGAVVRVIVAVACTAVATWIHGSWYLFGLVVLALALAGRRRNAAVFAACWMAGAIMGAFATGYGLTFLTQHLLMGHGAFQSPSYGRFLVGEFQSSGGAFPAAVLVAVVLLWRRLAGLPGEPAWRNPSFLLMVLGWALGLRVARFWLDWGLPAGLAWLSEELSCHCRQSGWRNDQRRILVAAGACGALMLSASADLEGRWTKSLAVQALSENDMRLAGWLPDRGGILFSASMGDFYTNFYANPCTGWRYALGFEPALMRRDDLDTVRNIWWNNHAAEAYLPWVLKMKPGDRLLVPGDPGWPPQIPQLEWRHAVRGRWIGRLRPPE